MGTILGINPNNRLFLLVYVLGIHGIGSFIVSGGLEFAIAYGMYAHKTNDITLWAFPNTISGDCAVTVFIQCAVTWWIEEILIGFDIFNQAIPNFNIIKPPSSDLMRMYLEIPKEGQFPWDLKLLWFIPGTNQLDYRRLKKQDLRESQPLNIKNKHVRRLAILVLWLLNKAGRALIIACFLWAIIWPITMGILAGIGHGKGSIDYTYNRYPLPQVLKLIYGGVVGLIATPIMASVILMRTYYLKEQEEIKKESQVPSTIGETIEGG